MTGRIHEGYPKLLQYCLHFSQNQKDVCAIFSVVNSEYPACCCSDAERFLAHARGGRQNGVVWCVRFKQRAVIEFLFTDRQLGWKMHPSLWTADKNSQWNGVIHYLLGYRSLMLHRHTGKSWSLLYGRQNRWDMRTSTSRRKPEITADIMPCGQTITLDLYTQTPKTLHN